jgi:predicted dehydrogenase
VNGIRKRLAVVGAGSFGRNHLRVIGQMDSAELAGVCDVDPNRAAEMAQLHNCPSFAGLGELAGNVDGVIVATPTSTHVDIGLQLIELGMDILVEKPIAGTVESARHLVEAANRAGSILQVGHLERFNPAVIALTGIRTVPLFFEVHRMSLFSPRSLDVDVVLDLMIHDIDVVLSLTGKLPEEIRAAGISILSQKVDIANVRLAFPGGCIANLTASRVSTERVRKLRLFQPGQYISVDYARQDIAAFRVSADRQISFEPVDVHKDEPLRLELESFVKCMETRMRPVVGGEDAVRALGVAGEILDKIEEHAGVVAHSLGAR